MRRSHELGNSLSGRGRTTFRWGWWGGCVLLAGAICGLPDAGRADVVILKDGYTLHGVYGKEKDVTFDNLSGQAISVNRIGGLTAIDDGVRWIIFSTNFRQLGDIDKNVNIFANHIVFKRDFFAKPKVPLPAAGEFGEPKSDFNDKWARVVPIVGPGIKSEMVQFILGISPHAVQLVSSNYIWRGSYLTKEFEPSQLRSWIMKHQGMKETPDKPVFEVRMRLFQFFFQSGWHDEAEYELNQAAKLFPEQQAKIAELQEKLKIIRAELLLEEIDKAKAAGRHQWALERLNNFPRQGIPPSITAKATAMLAQYETAVHQWQAAQRYLDEVPNWGKDVIPPFLLEAARQIRGELNLDSVARVEAFVTQAEQAERDRKAQRAEMVKPDELLALAVTGWLQGKNAAEARVATADRLWKARTLIQNYLTNDQPALRRKMLETYLKSSEAIDFDVFAQLVALSPPPLADPKVEPQKPIEMRSEPTKNLLNGIEYIVQLPPEYQHSRPYPLLIALQDPTEKPTVMFQRLGAEAAKHGYILAVPKMVGSLMSPIHDWTRSDRLDLPHLLRDLRRRFHVDSDRVFLLGNAEGASMAFDLAVSHPDLLAGVLPVNPVPSWKVMFDYWRNAQYLPFYTVMGSLTGDAPEQMRKILTEWMPRGYPSLTVVYKGRVREWFAGEVPYMFDWMSRKKRVHAFPNLGTKLGFGEEGEEFRSLRKSDNRFYWLSTDEVMDRYLLEHRRPNGQSLAAKFFGKILEGNQIQVHTLGLKNVTIWLERGMIDFERPVSIVLNGKLPAWNNGGKPLKPSVEVLMEDFYDRCDRQKLFLQKLTFDKP